MWIQTAEKARLHSKAWSREWANSVQWLADCSKDSHLNLKVRSRGQSGNNSWMKTLSAIVFSLMSVYAQYGRVWFKMSQFGSVMSWVTGIHQCWKHLMEGRISLRLVNNQIQLEKEWPLEWFSNSEPRGTERSSPGVITTTKATIFLNFGSVIDVLLLFRLSSVVFNDVAVQVADCVLFDSNKWDQEVWVQPGALAVSSRLFLCSWPKHRPIYIANTVREKFPESKRNIFTETEKRNQILFLALT